MTARPEQLQLMLYDGAIRFVSQAREAIEKKEIENSFNLLTRAQNIVREMENGLRHEVAPEICGQMASLYRFVFSRLVDANVNKDVQAVDDALKVLRHQRESWAMLADKIQMAQTAESPVMQQAEGVETPQDSISLEG